MLLAFCFAVAIIASSVTRSPLFAFMCCLVALLSYQKGVGIGIACAVVVVGIAFSVGPFSIHPFSVKLAASAIALLVVAVV
ncbi:MAG: hypothetical protein ACREMU_15095, partial [Gemmatimonadaceae bacterium]